MFSNKQALLQCLECGARLQDAKSGQFTAEERAQMNEFDTELREIAWKEENAERERARLLKDERKKAEEEAERENYSAYLRSEEWGKKRKHVLARCRGVCEGCGTNTATEVHHITYRDKYQEFLFQLVGICRDCHSRYHGHDNH